MGKFKKKFLPMLTVAMMVCALLQISAFAADISVSDTESFEQAVASAADGDTIKLTDDITTSAGLNLKTDLTIDGNSHTITFDTYGFALWGKSLTIKNAVVEMTGVGSTPYTAEWNWMSICASKNSSMTLENTTMTMDGTGTNSTHAIYFCGNDKLNLTNSTLTIKNYKQDALEWDGGDGGYNVNLDKSTFISDKCRSGFTGTFYVTAVNKSKIDVINSIGNGSNGSHFVFNDATVNFSNNGSHGLSAGILTVDDSTVTANGNGGNGIHTTGKTEIINGSKVTIRGNDCSISSKWTIPGALYIAKDTTISGSTVKIRNNNGSGIYQNGGTLNIDSSADVSIVKNTADKLKLGGGIYVNGTANLADNVVLYNNHAATAGDDIYVPSGSITFGETQKGWRLDGAPDCTDAIDGWYDDVADARWEAHAAEEDGNHILKVSAGTMTDVALKAAHGIISEKTNSPGIAKSIIDEDGETDETTVAAGDTVTFKLESNVPDYLGEYIPADPIAGDEENTDEDEAEPEEEDDGRGSYLLTFHDQLDAGLTYTNNVKVTVNGKELDSSLFTVSTDNSDQCTVEVSMDLIKIYQDGNYFTFDEIESAPAIVVTYTAQANETISAGAYFNTAWVTYEDKESEKDKVEIDTYGIKIFKYDQTDDTVGLAGAEFELKDSNGNVIATLTSDNMGNAQIDGLDEGTYTLTETKAPDGYVKSSRPITVTLSGDADETFYATVNFANSPIPHTGGEGTRMYTLIGGTLLILAAGCLMMTRRRRAQ